MILNKKSRNIFLLILGFLVCLNLFAWFIIYNLNKTQFLEVVFFNVGQGDAIFIEIPQRQQILIDGGPDSTILEKLAKEMFFYDRSLDLIILTHPEKDHLTGLLEVLKRYKVEYILWTGVVRETSEWEAWEGLIEKEGAQIKIAKAGQRIILRDKEPKIFLDILYPFEKLEDKELENSNDTSIVASLVFGDISFLFTGDITKKIERELVIRENSCSNSCKFASLDSEVLKVAHHGSKTSSSQEFLNKVLPGVAVIQVGKNNYGHPASEVLANLAQFGIEILRTDEKGDIKIFSDGANLKIR